MSELTFTYPSGYQVANIYDPQSFLTRVVNTDNSRPLWVANEANALGQVTRYTLGDGSVTERTYTDETGLIEGIATTRGSATIMNQSYTFDHIGKLTERSDNLYGVVQDFCYDNMNRLTAARFDGCSAADTDYTYDPLGNITSKDGITDYAYAQTGNAGPHAMTAANGLSFEYDAAGNLLKARNAANQIVREVTWSAINKPTRISNNSHWTEIHYGPDQSRLKREDSTGRTTYYFGSLYEETSYGTEAYRVHAIGDFAHYIEDAYTGEGYHEYLHRDHLGSVVAKTTDRSSSDNEWLAYGAWGNRLQLAWDGMEEGPGYQAPSVRGYTDHEHLDPVGLIHMNGRVYDPELGRFLSPDPLIQAPYNTQSYNRYSYVFNNPLSFTDPSGYQATCPYDEDGCNEESDDKDNEEAEEEGVDVTGYRNELSPQAVMRNLLRQIAGYNFYTDMRNGGWLRSGDAMLNPQFAFAMQMAAVPQIDPGTVDFGGGQRQPAQGFVAPAGGIATLLAHQVIQRGGVSLMLASSAITGVVLSVLPQKMADGTLSTTVKKEGPFLVRFGPGPESAQQLGADARRALANGFPHGVSTKLVDRVSNSLLRSGRVAPLSIVQTQFSVMQTGNNPRHFTVVLPDPVTEFDASNFNTVFRSQ